MRLQELIKGLEIKELFQAHVILDNESKDNKALGNVIIKKDAVDIQITHRETEKTEITNIAYDSRKVTQGSIFVCIDGFKVDGHQYIGMAIEKGAKAIIVQKNVEFVEADLDILDECKLLNDGKLSKDASPIEDVNSSNKVAVIHVQDTREALSYISDRFYLHPSHELSLIGVTGTKGKTTTTYMLKAIFEACGDKVGLIGTVANSIADEIIPTERTTPESVELQGLFREMITKEARKCVMEVSSHALELKRVAHCEFKIGIFTNLTQDHLDFHHTFENYLNAKAKLFKMCEYGIVNVDSEYGREILKDIPCKVYTIGIENSADIRAINIVQNRESVEFDLLSPFYNGKVKVSIPGVFTVYNALCAIATAMVLEIPFQKVLAGLQNIKVPGRAEVVEIGKEYTIMIDYAHSPDSLENILKSIKQFAKGRVISVFGCGGDRDRTKRPIMGEISGKISDYTIITSDNPRTETPIEIIKEIEEGIKPLNVSYITIEDRKQAIAHAMSIAKKDDVIVVAGKGHETYQIFKDGKIHFDEREVIKELSEKRD